MATKQDQPFYIDFQRGIADRANPERLDATTELSASVNTRLTAGLEGEVTKAPDVVPVTLVGGPAQVHGIAGLEFEGTGIAYMRPKRGQARLPGGGDIRSTERLVSYQNGFVPVRVDSAGVVPGSEVEAVVSIVKAAGRTWISAVRTDAATAAKLICVTVLDADGSVLVGGQIVWVSPYTTMILARLTQHNGQVILWTYPGGVLPIQVHELTLGTNVVTKAAPVSLFVPLASNPVVVGDDPQYGWVVARHPSTATSVRVARYQLGVGAAGQLDIPNFGDVGCRFSLAYLNAPITGGGADQKLLGLCVTDTNVTLLTCVASIDGAAMTAFWTLNGQLFDGDACAVAFHATSTASLRLVVAVSEIGANAETQFRAWHVTSSASPLAIRRLYWQVLNTGSASASWDLSVGDSLEVYPLFFTGRRYETDPFSVRDPSQVALLVHVTSEDLIEPTPIARFAVDQQVFGASTAAHLRDSRLLYAWIQNELGRPPVYRRIEFDLRPRGVPVAQSDGVAVLPGALPVEWDGIETAEYGWLYRPFAGGQNSGGAGPTLTGTYRYVVTYVRLDARGNRVRSAPSQVVELTPAGTAVQMSSTVPLSFRSGVYQDAAQVELWGTAWDGSAPSVTYHLVMSAECPATLGFLLLNTIPDTDPEAEILPSTGRGTEELLPEPPPPLWDVWPYADRLGGINAENRGTFVYTKPKSRDPGYMDLMLEWNGFLTVPFPASAGDLMAVRNMGTTPVIFAENGVYVLDGQGPDARGQGQLYGQPRQISVIGCASRDSVVQTPAGIVFVAQTKNGRRFAILDGNGVRTFDRVACPEIAAAFAFGDQREVVYLAGEETQGNRFRVYNWALDAWTSWNNLPASAALSSPGTVDGVAYAQQTSLDGSLAMVRMDPGSVAQSVRARITLQPGWVAVGGEHGDCNYRLIWFSGVRLGPHGVRITVHFDYGTASPQVATWADADIRTVDGRYTLEVKVTNIQVRAIRVLVEELQEGDGSGQGMRPISLCIYSDFVAGPQLRAILPGNQR